MIRNSLHSYKLFYLVIASLFSFVSIAHAETVVDEIGKDSFGLAINGYDSVAYFTEGKAVKGNEKYSFTWNEAIWQFSTAEHKRMFTANPNKYVPHRGGW